MIIGMGTDLASTGLFEREVATSDSAFLREFFTQSERDFCLRGATPPAHRLAGRYAAKEAFVKAISTALGSNTTRVDYREIEVTPLPTGAPQIILHGQMEAIVRNLGPIQMWVSISHECEFAMATVILEKRDLTT